MGESMAKVEEPVVESKMGTTADVVGNLEVSISFGRFENDLLQWERWSTFSPNKYLEEVEKCSTPGSVAEKKAYFEAHYKKIAAKKAEIEEPQRHPEMSLLMTSKPDVESSMAVKASETENEDKQLEADLSVEEKLSCDCECPAPEKSEIVNQQKQLKLDRIAEKTTGASPVQCTRSVTADFESSDGQNDDTQLVKVATDLNNEPGRTNVDKQTVTDGNLTTIMAEKQESEPKSKMGSGTVIESKHEIRFKGPPSLVEVPAEADPGVIELSKSRTTEMTKLKPPTMMMKVLLANMERNVTRAKKAPLSVAPKSSPISTSTPKKSTPMSTTSMTSSSRSSYMKGSNSSVSSSISLNAKHDKLAPRAYTASQSSGLARSAPAPAPAPVTRKSTFMEKMGDKEIVKRAFRSFQSTPVPVTSPGEQTCSLPKQVPRNTKEIRATEPLTSHKGKEWLPKTGAVVSNGAKPTLHAASSRSDTMGHKGKEKLNGNPNVKLAVGSHIVVKLKEAKETTKDLRQSHNFKATPLPEFYRGTAASKGLTHKGKVGVLIKAPRV